MTFITHFITELQRTGTTFTQSTPYPSQTTGCKAVCVCALLYISSTVPCAEHIAGRGEPVKLHHVAAVLNLKPGLVLHVPVYCSASWLPVYCWEVYWESKLYLCVKAYELQSTLLKCWSSWSWGEESMDGQYITLYEAHMWVGFTNTKIFFVFRASIKRSIPRLYLIHEHYLLMSSMTNCKWVNMLLFGSTPAWWSTKWHASPL